MSNLQVPSRHSVAAPIRISAPNEYGQGVAKLQVQTEPAEIIATSAGAPESDPAQPADLSSHAGIADALVAAFYPGGLFYVGGKFHTIALGASTEIGHEEIKRNLSRLLGRSATAALVNRVVHYCAMTHVVTEMEREPIAGNVYFANGRYDLKTDTLETAASPVWVHGVIPHAYVSTTDVPNCLLQFLSEVFEGEADIEQRIAFVQEWMGWLMIADTIQQKMLVLYGNGANGKSLLCKVFEALVGQKNVSHATPDRLSSPAVRSTLEGKLLNISSDLPNKSFSDGYLKAIVAGDKVDVEQKYRDPRTVSQYCRLVVSTNHLPPTRDHTNGFFRRLVILQFNRKFEATANGQRLVSEIVAEMPQVIAWALVGLKRLQARGHFVIPPSSDAVLAEYRTDIDPVQRFADECLLASPGGTDPWSAKDLFACYGAWCKANGFARLNVITFGKALSRLGFTSRKISTRYWDVALTANAECYFPKPWNGPTAQSATTVVQLGPLGMLNQPEVTSITLG